MPELVYDSKEYAEQSLAEFSTSQPPLIAGGVPCPVCRAPMERVEQTMHGREGATRIFYVRNDDGQLVYDSWGEPVKIPFTWAAQVHKNTAVFVPCGCTWDSSAQPVQDLVLTWRSRHTDCVKAGVPLHSAELEQPLWPEERGMVRLLMQ